MPNLSIGSIQWTNHSFTTISPRSGLQISGVMHYNEDGLPDWMNVAIGPREGAKHSVIKYRYTKRLSVEGLPDRFEHYFLQSANSMPDRVVTI
ncbi:MAG TPA: hypothetical protein VEH27_10710 [Methylomirabilota bacterium]|nr:hypothetical protein [Methylomirabilota bacterium]